MNKTNLVELDLASSELREINAALQGQNGTEDSGAFRVLNPAGSHALAVGLDAPVSVEISGHVGYFCAGMNKAADVMIDGNAGQGVAENMMSGRVHVKGDASQAAGATAHGGLLVIEGNAAARCGISLKGADIVVKGSVGHMTCFMAQAGRVVVCGDAGDALGDSLYETRIYVRGDVKSLGADCIEKELREEHLAELQQLLDAAECDAMKASEFRRYGSARELYNFKIENVDAY
jgi:glutamate synthase domain-containing protein 3